MFKVFGLAGAVALCFGAGAWADDNAAAEADTQVSAPQTRTPLTDIPASHPNADKRIEESMSIKTEALHGFSIADLEKKSAERIAQLTGATNDPSVTHPSVNGFGEYRLGAGDVLEFTLFNEPPAEGRPVTVRFDGYISLPRVPDIKVGGLTRPEAEAEVRRVYSQIYRNPEVSLAITNPDSKAYVVTGDVQLPGRYAYTRETSIWDAISLAGGLRQRNTGNGGGGGYVAITGQITKAFVIRRIDGERKVVSYDLRGFGESGAYRGDEPIYYGDVIYVPEGVNLVYLLGESQSPVIVELTEGMTLLQMLALSGGFNQSTARISDVVLLRQVDDETTDIHRVNVRRMLKNKAEDMVLQPGDIVYIPQKALVRLSEFVQRFTGTVSPLFGLYTQAIDAVFAYSLNRETLDALENNNSVAINPVSAGATQGVTRVPRVFSPQTNPGATINK